MAEERSGLHELGTALRRRPAQKPGPRSYSRKELNSDTYVSRETHPALETPEGTQPCPYLDFSPVRPVLDV